MSGKKNREKGHVRLAIDLSSLDEESQKEVLKALAEAEKEEMNHEQE